MRSKWQTCCFRSTKPITLVTSKCLLSKFLFAFSWRLPSFLRNIIAQFNDSLKLFNLSAFSPTSASIHQETRLNCAANRSQMMLNHSRPFYPWIVNKNLMRNSKHHRRNKNVELLLNVSKMRRDKMFYVRWYVHHKMWWKVTNSNRSSRDIFVCGTKKHNLKILEIFQVSKKRKVKKKMMTTNHFTSSSSKLAISSHAETLLNQSFWWFNGVITLLVLEVAEDHKKLRRGNIIGGVQKSFNIRFQGWWFLDDVKMKRWKMFRIFSSSRNSS